MNTYIKFAPNVWIAKCPDPHQKNETIRVETKYGWHYCIVFNLIMELGDGFFYYSVTREDGFNANEWARRRAERLQRAAMNADKKSESYFQASNKDAEFLSLGEPIKVGHHSEKRHRKIVEQAQNNMSKSVELSKQAEEYQGRASYWEGKANIINLSMPESLEFYEYELEKAKARHEGLKNGRIPRDHGFSLTYAKKEVNELEKKLELAQRLWGDVEPKNIENETN